MADVAVTHPFVSAKADGADTTRARPSNWNASHVYAGGAAGQVPIYDAGSATLASWAHRAKVLTVDTTAVGNVGAGEDDLISYTMPSNTLGTDGQTLRVTGWGTCAANANAKTIKLKFGTASVTLNPLTVAPNGDCWRFEAVVIRTGAAAQEVMVTAQVSATPEVAHRSAPTQDLTAAVVIKCTGEATSDDDISQKGLLVEQLN